MMLRLFLVLAAFTTTQPGYAKEGDTAFSVSPDSSFISLTTALMEARTSIDVNIYMFTSKNIGEVLARKADEGVAIRVLVEGEPHGGSVFPAVKQTLDQLNEAFKRNKKTAKLYVMTGKKDKSKRRYVYNHAKYVIVDAKKVFVSSDNFTASAFPDPSRTIYSGGTRGWQVYLENTRVAKAMGAIFTADVTGKKDVVRYDKAELNVSDPGNGSFPKRDIRTVQPFGIELGKSGKASICASPNSEKCVIDFIRSAKVELAVEHLSLPYYWKEFGTPKAKQSGGPINPFVTELLAAAKRGVKVRILVNDEKTFADDGKPEDVELTNSFLVKLLNKEAKAQRLPLEAALFDPAKTQTSYVHNKGMIADGQRVFVSSINGTENSVENNREIALSIETKDGARFYGEVFEFDWQTRQR